MDVIKASRSSNLTSLLQLILLTVVIVAVYWHGIYAGAPRSDHLGYLHQVGQYKTFPDIFFSALSFNRTESAGDFLLYRPLVYLQLGLNYFFFGYDFAKWQLMSLVLHVWLVARLFLLFPFKLRQRSALPFLFCLLFATSAIASEQVLWNHITGYLIYLHLTLTSLTYLQSYLTRNGTHRLILSLLFAFLAQFTYELGVIYCVLVACFLLKESFQRYWRQAILYFSCALFYTALSAYDLFRLGIWTKALAEKNASIASGFSEVFLKLPEIIGLAFFQLFFWFGGIFLPQVLNLTLEGRTRIDGLRVGEWLSSNLNWLPNFLGYSQAERLSFFHVDAFGGHLFFINFSLGALASLLAFGHIMSLRSTYHQIRPRAFNRLAIIPILLLTTYALLIALGRTEPRGVHTLGNNLYYAYTAHFFLLAGGALLFRQQNHSESAVSTIRNRRLLAIILAAVCALNIAEVIKLTHHMRYQFSEPRQVLISEILTRIASDERDERFIFSLEKECDISKNLDWLTGGHIRRDSNFRPPFNYLDALFPENSAKVLNNSKNPVWDTQITLLLCPE